MSNPYLSLKFPIGSKWITRSGKIVTITSHYPTSHFPVHGTYNGKLTRYTSEGHYLSRYEEDRSDLIERVDTKPAVNAAKQILEEAGYTVTEPEKPEVIEMNDWITLYKNPKGKLSFGGHYESKEKAKAGAMPNVYAVVKVDLTVTKGEGL